MSLNDILLMEVLDDRVPEAYRQSVKQKISSDSRLSSRLRVYRSVKRFLLEDDENFAHQYQESSERLKKRLLSIATSTEQGPRFSFQWIPAAAAFVLAFVLVSSPNNQIVGNIPANMGLANSTELSQYDPNLVDLLTVNEATSENGDGINLQINVQDMEQLLLLLERAQNFNGSINSLTIQLPDINEFELLGESQFLRVPPIRGE